MRLLVLMLALLAVAAAPASARVPIASPADGTSRGTVLLIHGGSWVDHGPRAARRQHRRHAARLNALGLDTLSITYRPGIRSIRDVIAAYDALRGRLGPRERICALGDSAGGHLALMLAARRAGLDCAISRGGPTDLTHAHGIWLRPVRRRLAPFAPLERISPVTYGARLAGRVLASQALADPLVAHDQLVRLGRTGVRTVSLPSGTADYVHAGVDPAALRRLERLEARLLRPAREGPS